MKKKLTKSNTNVVLSGVLGGIGEYFRIDPTILRVIFMLLLVFGVGTPALIYLLLVFIIPAAPRMTQSWQRYDGYGNSGGGQRTRKEAEKIHDNDDWSDF